MSLSSAPTHPRPFPRLAACATLLAAVAALLACGDDGGGSATSAGGAGAGQGAAGGQGGAGGAGGQPAVCGNGVSEAGETCDGDCPTACPDDGDACTGDVLQGSAATCDAVCAHEPLTACVSSDGCCPAGCAAPQDFDCLACDVVVPDDHPTIGEAILAAPAPGVVCIRPGQYVEDLTLRPRVALQGFGPASEILGHLSVEALGDADPTPTAIRDLSVRADSLAIVTSCPASDSWCNSTLDLTGSTLALQMERVILDADPSTGTVYCAELKLNQGALRFDFRDSICRGGDRGLRLVGYLQASPVDYEVLIERSRFEPSAGGDYIYDAVEFLTLPSGSCGQQVAPDGTRVRATIINNEFFRTRYEGVYTTQCLALAPADAMQSAIVVANNTFVVQEGATGDMAYAIWNNSVPGLQPSLVVANNLSWGTNPSPVRGAPPNITSADLVATVDPFADLAGGDLRLAADGAPIDAADPAFAPPVDKSGAPRPVDGDQDGTSLPDVGAHEYVP